MGALSLADLVRNRTLSPEMAATLAVAAIERRSLLFVAIPRLAGKTTLLHATLAEAPPGTPVHLLSRAAGPSLGIPATADGGYLLMAEISPVGFADYLWDADVREVFARLAGGGFSLATALHAGGYLDAMSVITHENGVPAAQAAALDLFVYIRSLGPWERPARRVVAEIRELTGAGAGVAGTRLLHRWDEAGDVFESPEAPARLGTLAGSLERERERFRALTA